MIKNCKQIQMICADYGMCGQIRVNCPAEVLKNGSNLQIHNSRNFIPSLPSDCVIVQRCLDKKFNAIVKPVKYKKVADFIIAPLKENVFNKCKSNLKYLESCAVGAVCIGSSFEFSPYSMIDDMAKINWTMTAKQLEYNIFELCKKENYNRILDKQYIYINENWLENNIDKYLEIFTDKIVGI